MENITKIKREQSSLIIKITVFIIFLIIVFMYLLKEYDKYLENKLLLIDLNNKYNELSVNWLSFEQYRDKISSDQEWLTLLEKIWKDFYDNNLKNENEPTYLAFIDKLQNKFLLENSSDYIKNRDEKISKVLPSFKQWVEIEWNLKEVEFLNNIEKILKTFNLKNKSSIWISEVIPYEEFEKDENWNENIDTLSNQIYYIPVSLELIWEKNDFVDFFHFIWNVWSIDVITNDKTSFYKDTILSNKVFPWELRSANYNIYENPILNVSKLELKKYIDQSSSYRNKTQKNVSDFISFLKKDENWKEEFNVDLTLDFYVKWLPIYEVTKYITDISDKFFELNQENKKLLLQIQIRNENLWSLNKTEITWILNSIDLFFKENEETVQFFISWLNDLKNIDRLYLQAYNLDYQIQTIKTVLDQTAEKINKVIK